jgi:hypothetical protein
MTKKQRIMAGLPPLKPKGISTMEVMSKSLFKKAASRVKTKSIQEATYGVKAIGKGALKGWGKTVSPETRSANTALRERLWNKRNR